MKTTLLIFAFLVGCHWAMAQTDTTQTKRTTKYVKKDSTLMKNKRNMKNMPMDTTKNMNDKRMKKMHRDTTNKVGMNTTLPSTTVGTSNSVTSTTDTSIYSRTGSMQNGQVGPTQNSGVPSVVSSNFGKTYPNVRTPQWEQKNGNFTASYDDQEVNHTVTYDNMGKVTQTGMVVATNTLPQSSTDYLRTNYGQYTPDKVIKLTDADANVMYNVSLKSNDVTVGKPTSLYFDKMGTFVRVENPTIK